MTLHLEAAGLQFDSPNLNAYMATYDWLGGVGILSSTP
jgi:hypothetical protein